MKLLLVTAAICMLSYNSNSQNTGCVSGDCLNGYGTYHFKNGDIYEGFFENTHLNGFGKYTDSNGNIYVGDFKNDLFDGIGKFTRTDGTWYIGEFKEGKRHGMGSQYYSKSFKDKGKWENDRFVGEADFDEFVVADEYDFCSRLTKIVESSPENFEKFKGNPISDYIKGSYYSTLKFKELTADEISDNDGYKASYFKGSKTDAQKKLDELKDKVSNCLSNSCITYKETFLNGVETKMYKLAPQTISSNCNQALLKTNIELIMKVKGADAEVIIRIYQDTN